MNPATDSGRWAKIDQLYQVLSLLRFDNAGQAFLQRSPLDAAQLSLNRSSTLIGKKVGQYTILSLVGTGGMGEVYRASDPRLGREVAIKVLPEALARNPEMLSRFQREARIVASLSHPNILSIHDFGDDQGITYAVTELLEGETLASVLQRGPLDWRRAAEIGLAIAEGLAAAHAKGIVHRDLKPANVFITSDNRVKILDFGIARVKPGTQAVTSHTVTQPGAVIGTVGYMSPEQVRGENVDALSDLFTFGTVLFEMLTGRNPFERRTNAETMAAILNENPSDLADAAQDVPASMRTIIDHCLRKNPSDRLVTASELAQRLKAPLIEHVTTATIVANRLLSKRVGAWLFAGAALLVMLIFPTYWFQRRTLPAVPVALQVRSIAVLPFKPLAGSSDEALEFGMTDTLITRLSSIRDVVVRPISAVRSYVASNQDPLHAGKEQKVDAVLEGGVQRVGERVRITARLLRVQDGSSLWAKQFDGSFTDIFSVQDKISDSVVRALALKVGDVEQAGLRKHYTENSEAYRLYLLGRFHWDKRTTDQVQKAIEYFEKAIDSDPNYALAYTGLADAYSILGGYGALPTETAHPKARQYAEKALAMDEGLAEAHVSLAATLTDYYWDWSGAGREFQRAIELNPSNVQARYWYGGYLAQIGRFDMAEIEANRALQIDPLSLIGRGALSIVYYRARKYADAINVLNKALEMDSSYVPAHFDLGLVFMETREYDRAIQHLLKMGELSGQKNAEPGLLGMAYALAGKEKEARAILERIQGTSNLSVVSPLDVAFVYIGLREHDRAFEWLEKAYEERRWQMGLLKVDPKYDPLRKDPRFNGLLRRVGLRE